MSKPAKKPRTKLPKTSPKEKWKTILGVVGDLLKVLVAVIAAQLIVGYITLMIVGQEGFAEPVVTAIYTALSYLLAMCLILLPSMRKRRQPKVEAPEPGAAKAAAEETVATKPQDQKSWRARCEQIGLRGLPTWTDIGLALVGFIVYALVASVLIGIFENFPWFDSEQEQDVGFGPVLGGGDLLIAFLTLVVVAPIAEEIIFRGWLYGKLRQRFSLVVVNGVGMALSILLVSLLFGIVHLQWNVGVNVFAMSLVLCGMREITGTIHSGILLHMLKNGLAFYLLYVAVV